MLLKCVEHAGFRFTPLPIPTFYITRGSLLSKSVESLILFEYLKLLVRFERASAIVDISGIINKGKCNGGGI